jgi:seryl-tRNA synthetase
MLDLKLLESDPEGVARALRRRGDIPNLDELLQKARERKAAIHKVEADQARRNAVNAEMKGASKEVIEERRAEMRALSEQIKSGEATLRALEEDLQSAALVIPNAPRDDVPDGNDEHGNVEVRKVGTPRTFDFPVKDHVDLGESLGILDQARAAKVSGARFSFLRGTGARLERALAAFMLDFHLGKGDTELSPPLLVNAQTMKGTGQLPKFADDSFSVAFGTAAPSLYLIPTAEVPLTNYFADEILEESQLPLRLCAQSSCFRAEAGAAGRDTRGLIRQHQFQKVEMVRFATPDQALAELDDMVGRASDILSALELPHRVMLLCAGDMGFSSEKTFDLEVWLPGQAAYREISSCSTCGSFQARRAQIRYRPTEEAGKKAKPRPLVTLNGSGLAVGRTLIALLENHQQADGSVRIPDKLRPYLGGLESVQPAP